MLMKELEDRTNRWKDIPWSYIGRINTVKMNILPEAIQCNPYEITKTFYTELQQKIFNSYGNTKDPE